jgi:pimeloyl-[acyl-carrier protein] methyl ester esterase
VLAAAPERAVWLGWSLGGMLALQAALAAPERVERLAVVASTPRFVADADWPHGLAAETLARFAGDLERDFRATVQQFLALQVQGDPESRILLRELRAKVFRHGEPHPEVLARGLDILRDADLRPCLKDVAQPALVISGRLDRLTHPDAGRALAGALPRAEYHLFPRAAHAQFLSAPAEFASRVIEFMNEKMKA